jgi:FdrA protein
MAKKFEELLTEKPVFINVGVGEFGRSLSRQGFDAIEVVWSPPAGGDRELADLLDKLL